MGVRMPSPHHLKQTLYRAATGAAQDPAGQCSAKQKTLSLCQLSNTDIWGNTYIVTHAVPGCSIASLHSASQFWQVKPSVLCIQEVPQICYKLPCKTNTSLFFVLILYLSSFS